VFIVFWLDHAAISVIEEKGEGFENGKKRFLATVGSAFNLDPPTLDAVMHRNT
jgi:hypothetical protein